MAGKRQTFLEGQTFGTWLVGEYQGKNKYLCACKKCGEQKSILGNFLQSGKIPACPSCAGKVGGRGTIIDMKGKTIGEWKVLCYDEESKESGRWICQCSCGTIRSVSGYLLRSGQSNSCGHNSNHQLVNLKGKTFGEWKVLEQAPTGPNGETMWRCQCSCGTIRDITGYRLRNGLSKSCGHATTGFKDLKGMTFGELKVLHISGNQPTSTHTMWTCECSCGNIIDVDGYALRSGNTKSCGCKKEEFKKQTNLEKYGVPQVGMLRSSTQRTSEQIAMTSSPENLIAAIKANFNYKPGTLELSKLVGVTVATIRLYAMRHNLEDYVSIAESTTSSYELALRDLFPGGIPHDRRALGGRELDILFKEARIALEFNGDYWHNELKIDKNYHQEKSLLALKNGIRIIHIFEYEWVDKVINPKLITHIRRALGMDVIHTIGARNCEVTEIDALEAKEFLDKYHLQGFAAAQTYLGLKYSDRIAGIMSFGKPRFNSQYDYEMIRMCWISGITVVGGAQKLLKYFIDKYQPKSIVSYCDISKFSGEIYKQLGFELLEITSPNYRWVDTRNHKNLSRYQTQKQRLIDAGLGGQGNTEEEIMQNLGYVRIYDCGNAKYVWRS